MIKREDLIEIGVYNKPHGINGEISATFDYDLGTISDVDCFISEINGIFVPFFAENKRAKNDSTALLKIEGLDDEESVKKLVNHVIYTIKSNCNFSQELSENNDELPLDYFIGFSIIENESKQKLGKIVDVDCSTENYLFIIEYKENKVFIPATDDFITDIDLDKKILIMSLPIGILEI